jgi:predicted ester cyclase
MPVSIDDNKRVVADFIETCQNQHNLAYADEIYHPDFVNHYMPGGNAIVPAGRGPGGGFQAFYGMLLRAFPDARFVINEQLGERDLVATRKTLHATHLGELWGFQPTGNKIEFEFIDIFRVKDGKLIEHWTHMDFDDLRKQMRPRD